MRDVHLQLCSCAVLTTVEVDGLTLPWGHQRHLQTTRSWRDMMRESRGGHQGRTGGPNLGLPHHVLPDWCCLQMPMVSQATPLLTNTLKDPTQGSLASLSGGVSLK